MITADRSPDRTQDRLARIKGLSSDAAASVVQDNAPAPVRATERQGGLGPNQLAWLRAKVPSFEICERLAIGSEEHRQKLLDAVRP